MSRLSEVYQRSNLKQQPWWYSSRRRLDLAAAAASWGGFWAPVAVAALLPDGDGAPTSDAVSCTYSLSDPGQASELDFFQTRLASRHGDEPVRFMAARFFSCLSGVAAALPFAEL